VSTGTRLLGPILMVLLGIVWLAVGLHHELSRPVPTWVEPHPMPTIGATP